MDQYRRRPAGARHPEESSWLTRRHRADGTSHETERARLAPWRLFRRAWLGVASASFSSIPATAGTYWNNVATVSGTDLKPPPESGEDARFARARRAREAFQDRAPPFLDGRGAVRRVLKDGEHSHILHLGDSRSWQPTSSTAFQTQVGEETAESCRFRNKRMSWGLAAGTSSHSFADKSILAVFACIRIRRQLFDESQGPQAALHRRLANVEPIGLFGPT